MKDINEKNLKVINKKVGKLSMDLARGNIKSGDELAKAILKEMDSEEILVASTLLIIERYNIIKQKFFESQDMDKENLGVMYR